MQDSLQLVRAVDIGRFVLLRVDGRQRRQIQYGIPAGLLPDVREDVDAPIVSWIAQQVFALTAGVEEVDNQVDDALGAHEVSQQAADDDGGDEVGHVADGLNGPLAQIVAYLVNHQREQDGDRKAEDQAVQAEHQRVPQKPPEIAAVEEGAEVLEKNELASRNTLEGLVVLERNDHAGHRPELE